MIHDRRKALDLAIRRNRGRRIRDKWLPALGDACGIEITSNHLLSIEETQKLKQLFFERMRAGQYEFHKYWLRTAFGEIEDSLQKLASTVDSLAVVLFSSVDPYIGAVTLPADAVFRHVSAVWQVVEQDLRVTTQDLETGLLLEFNPYADVNGQLQKDVYELIAWGKLVPQG